jgi:hemoglobin-like flavoprotein
VRPVTIDKELLRKSFALFIACEPDLTHHFYEVFFERHPEARTLFFRRSLAEQARLLSETLARLVEHIDDTVELEKILVPLGIKHIEYGATPEKYVWVREALLATFRHVAGAVWSDDLAATWSEAYDRMAAIMIEAAARRGRGGA